MQRAFCHFVPLAFAAIVLSCTGCGDQGKQGQANQEQVNPQKQPKNDVGGQAQVPGKAPGRYQLAGSGSSIFLCDTVTGQCWFGSIPQMGAIGKWVPMMPPAP